MSLKRNLLIFITISIIAALFLLFFTVSPKTVRALKEVRLGFLFLALSLWFIYVGWDALRFKLILAILGERIMLRRSAQIILIGSFMAAITPFASGGLPVQLYLLEREGIRVSNGGAALLVRGLLVFVLLIILVPIVMVVESKTLGAGIIAIIFRYLIIIYGILLSLLFLLLVKPKVIKRMGEGIVRFLQKRKLFRISQSPTLAQRVGEEITRFRSQFISFFKEHPKGALGTFFLTLLSSSTFLLIIPTLLYGLGLNPPILRSILLQIALTFLLSFPLTPGASGVAEAGGAAIYSIICPISLLGIFTILWRFFSTYLGAGIGGLVLLKILGIQGLKELSKNPSLRRCA